MYGVSVLRQGINHRIHQERHVIIQDFQNAPLRQCTVLDTWFLNPDFYPARRLHIQKLRGSFDEQIKIRAGQPGNVLVRCFAEQLFPQGFFKQASAGFS